MKQLLLLFACAGFLGTSASAQQVTEPVLKSLPKAVNPKDGYGQGGTVVVQVRVDEKGDVTDAEFARGPGPVCDAVTRPDVVKTREAAIAIARRAKFAPAMNGDQPVASTTTISVEFAVPTPKAEGPSRYDRMTVMGTTDRGDTAAKTKSVQSSGNESTPRTTMTGSTAGVLTAVDDETAAKIANGGGKIISGGVLNGRAVSLPKPSYPPAARAVRASGAVQVQVLIDEDGDVFSADAVGGQPLLQRASVIAACSSRFSPTLLEGNPVKVSGIITYNFVP
jgi:outer membrane biosynthesis protein TonB